VGDPGRIADRIEYRPASDNHDVRSTIEPVSFDGREDVIDALGVVFDLLAAGNDEKPGTVPGFLTITEYPGTVPGFLTTFRQPLTGGGRKGWIGDCRVMIADF
jgi:hypothetical protein